MQCRIPVRDADDWDPPVVDPQGAPGSMPGEQIVFDANKESEGHDFFRLGGLDLSKDGRWMLYGVDVAGDERYDFRIRDLAGLETGEPVSELPEQFTGIGSACFTPDGQWVFWVELDDSWRPLAVWRHRVGTAVESDVCVYRETDERFWVGVGISFDERNIVIGTGSKTTTEVLMLPVATPEGEFQAFIPRQNDIEYDVSFACFEGAGRTVRMCHSPWSTTTPPIRISKSTSLTCAAMSRRTDSAKACALPPGRRTAVNMVSRISRLPSILQRRQSGDIAGCPRSGHRRHRVASQLCVPELPCRRPAARGIHDQERGCRRLPGRTAWRFTELLPPALEDDWDMVADNRENFTGDHGEILWTEDEPPRITRHLPMVLATTTCR